MDWHPRTLSHHTKVVVLHSELSQPLGLLTSQSGFASQSSSVYTVLQELDAVSQNVKTASVHQGWSAYICSHVSERCTEGSRNSGVVSSRHVVEVLSVVAL